MDDPKEPPPMVFPELSQPPPRRPNAAYEFGPTGPIYMPEDPGGHNGTTGPNGPLTLGNPDLNGPTGGNADIVLRSVFAEGRAAGDRRASGTTISAETSVIADAILVKAPATVGRTVIANRDAILVQAMSAELLLGDVIDREKEARRNTGSAPELEAILAKVHDVRAMLAAAPSEPEVGATALLLKKCVLDWFDKDHVSILNLGYKSGLFVLLMGLIVYFGLIPATIAATLLSKDVGEALKQLVKLLKGD